LFLIEIKMFVRYVEKEETYYITFTRHLCIKTRYLIQITASLYVGGVTITELVNMRVIGLVILTLT